MLETPTNYEHQLSRVWHPASSTASPAHRTQDPAPRTQHLLVKVKIPKTP